MSLKKNTIWNLAGLGLPLLLGVVAIPFLYRHLGTEKIGILTLVWALIGYFSLFDFGLGRALTQQVSAGLATGKLSEISGLIKVGLMFTAITGLIGGVLLASTASILGTHWLHVSEPMQTTAVNALLIAAAGIPMTTMTTGLRGILEAYEDFSTVNLLRLVLGVANFGLPMLSVVWFGPSLIAVILSLIITRALIFNAHFFFVGRKLPAGWHKASVNKRQFRQLISFGAWMTVTNVVGPLMVTADRFVIAGVLGANVVAYYSIPSDMLSRILIIPVALTSALFPKLTGSILADVNAARKLYVHSLGAVCLVMVPTCLMIATGSFWGLSLWLGMDFAQHSWVVVSILAIGIMFNGIALVPYSVVQAAGRADVTAKIHVIELLFYIPLLIGMLHVYGLVGAAVTWLIRVALDLAALLFFTRRLGL